MPNGPEDIEPDDGGNPEDGPILSPEELEIAEDEHVTQLDEGRFVVSPDARQDSDQSHQPGTTSAEQPDPDPSQQPSSQQRESTSPQPRRAEQNPREQRREISRDDVHKWLRQSFENGGSRYGFDVTATFDGAVSQRRMASNDVVTIFESLILWYAQQVDEDTPVEEILGILLMEANVPIRYPPQSLKNLVKSTGLGPNDTIADLLAAVDEDDGVEL
ncbi:MULTISPECIES: DUF7500 family protein [Salinibaculum]|uniref:DUF7500 family protein n=1 Tax=Salinibaculum TaxID=2732368 RepID=UPI0030CF0A6D